MSDTSKPPAPLRLAMVDFQDGTRPNQETEALSKLVVGSDPLLYDHNGKRTPFSTWIATRRGRLGKAFAYDRFVRERNEDGTLIVKEEQLPLGQYYIWVVDPAKAVRSPVREPRPSGK